MTAEDIKQILMNAFVDAQIEVVGAGAKFEIEVISDVFEQKRPVARQQMIYSELNAYITSGQIHAITMRLLTKKECESN